MYKYHLSDVEWSEFFFSDVFNEVQRGKRLTKANQLEGKIPYISSTALNNGVDNFIGNKEKIRKSAKNITLANSGSVGACFYQDYEYIASDHVTSLTLKNGSKNVYMFISAIVKRLEEKYSFNREINDERIKREKLILPIDANKNPNWHFMEEYIKERDIKQRNELKQYYKSRLLDLVVCPEVLNDVEWKEFFIEEVAEIYSGKDIYERERTIGNTPYITATANNNGIGYFVGNENKTMESECISVNRNGSVGYAFYHCYEALYGNDTRKLKPFIKNKYTALFIAHAITSQKDKYGYGYKMGTNRLKRQKIMLPVSGSEVNYKYMEDFIKNIEQKQIKNVLKYLDVYIYIISHSDKFGWKEFFLSDVCNINSGVRLTKANMRNGNIPFIGATDSNNGITNFVSNTNASFDKNVLGVNYNGSVVENFYHPYSCVFSDDVKRVSFKNEQGQNKYCYMFLKQMILQQKEKYRYAYKFNGDRMARQKIMLPVEENNVILDYETIKNYMKAKEIKMIMNVLGTL